MSPGAPHPSAQTATRMSLGPEMTQQKTAPPAYMVAANLTTTYFRFYLIVGLHNSHPHTS